MSLKIYLLEDDWTHAEDLRITVQHLGHQWLGHTDNVDKALQDIPSLKPDVVVLDIRLHGIFGGFDLARKLQELRMPFIFVSSLLDDDIMQTGIHYHPVAYLTKPVNEGDLKAALLKAKATPKIAPDPGQIQQSPDSGQILVRVGRRLVPLQLDDIMFIESAEKNYAKIVTRQQETYRVKKSLTTLEEIVCPPAFCRIHREYIINLSFVGRIDEAEGIVYVGTNSLPLGTTYKQKFFSRFNIL